MRDVVHKTVRGIYSTLLAAGWVWLGISTIGPPVLMGTPTRRLDEPPAGHPERLCPHIPLSSTELALQRQLAAPIKERE
ncbi:DUF6059 family protein [Streptomyces laurentii]|jgi:hypothetical protein|uniref:Uncharacterized protein n=1 Tax=Streptomyces laurentii TaxID=39478 RepID=A0A160NZZ5_STRLU|nr:hypothetical protein SLA_3070 [Streptomyces laurentii]